MRGRCSAARAAAEHARGAGVEDTFGDEATVVEACPTPPVRAPGPVRLRDLGPPGLTVQVLPPMPDPPLIPVFGTVLPHYRAVELRTAVLVSGGLGAFGIAGGIYFGLRARSLSDQVARDYDIDNDRKGKEAERDMAISFSLGAAGLVTSAILYYLGTHSDSSASPVARAGKGRIVLDMVLLMRRIVSFALLGVAACYAPQYSDATHCSLARGLRPEGRTCVAGFCRTGTAAGDAAQLTAARIVVVSGDGQSGHTGAALAAPFVVAIEDAEGGPVAGFAVGFAVVAGGGTVSEASVVSDAQGRAQTKLTLGAAVGSNRVEAGAAGLLGSPIVFTAGALGAVPSRIDLVSGSGQSAVNGRPLPAPFVVSVVDAGSGPVDGFAVTFAVTGGGGSLSIPTVVTDAQGHAADDADPWPGGRAQSTRS